MRSAENIVVARYDRQLTASHNTKRFEEPPYGSKIAWLGIAGEVAGDDDVVDRVLLDRVLQHSPESR